MQELELAKALLEELKHIEELQQNVKESESDDITGHMGGHTLYCAVNYEKVSTGENSVRHFF